MAFVDEVTIHAQAGRGGDGVVRWLRTKMTSRGGHSGGDGGKGGDIVIRGVRDLLALSYYRYEKKFHAQDGKPGENLLKHGADGDDSTLIVPVGTVVHVPSTGMTYEITKEEEQVIFRGGQGGKGNARFKGATNQNPFQHTPGRDGEGGDLTFSLKIIADVGLVGLPNAGKSSLLNALTKAKAKVGAYPFTTLEPHLGDFYGYIIADIPGLIEGASAGKGLGVKFLKHIERTGIILHLIAADQEDLMATYKTVRQELASFGETLKEKREVLVVTKTDLCEPNEIDEKVQYLRHKTGREVFHVSVKDMDSVKNFSDILAKILTSGKL